VLILEQNQSEKLTLLRFAIENKYEISFWYKGVKFRDPKNKKYLRQNWRFAQPTGLGLSNASGQWMLRAYQTGGATNSKTQEWKTFLVDEMDSITVMSGNVKQGGGGYKAFDRPEAKYKQGRDAKMKDGIPQIYARTDTPKGPDLGKPQEPELELRESSGFLNWVIQLIK
jgi:hypothetical protein